MQLATLKKLNAYRQARVAAVVLTNLGDGSVSVVAEGDQVVSALGAAISSTFASAICT